MVIREDADLMNRTVPKEAFDAVMADACVTDFITAMGDPLYEPKWDEPPFTQLVEEYGLEYMANEVQMLTEMVLVDARAAWPKVAGRLSRLHSCPHCGGMVLIPTWNGEWEKYEIICQDCEKEV